MKKAEARGKKPEAGRGKSVGGGSLASCLMPQSSLVITNACVITGDGKVLENGFIHVQNGQISALGNSSKCPKLNGAKTIDAKGRYTLPGFINPHMHLYSALARGMGVPRMKTFGKVLKGLWWKLDNKLTLDDVYISALLGALEAVKSGVTTIVDHHASYGAVLGSLGMVSRALSETGLRGSLCYEISDRNGRKLRDEAIAESALWLECVASCVDEVASFSQRAMVGLHASMTLSDETLDLAKELMDMYSVGAHVHVAEGQEDVIITRNKTGMTPVMRFAKKGILRQGSIAAHCVHVDKKDIEALKKSGTNIVHNPLSNLNNAVGIAPIMEFAQKNIPFMVGTDGMSAGIADDVKLAACLHKVCACDAQAGGMEIQKAVWKDTPEFISNMFGFDIGILRKGAAADIIIIDGEPPTPVTGQNAWWHVLFGVLNSPVRTTIAGGSVCMEDFEVKGIDENVLAKEAKKLAKGLWKRI